MKNIIKMTVAAVALLATQITVQAQTSTPAAVTPSAPTPTLAPTTLPIDNSDHLREFALQQVSHGSRDISAPSVDWNWPGSVTYTNAPGKFAEDVLDKLFSVQFRYELENPADQIQGYVWLYDKNNTQLFAGSAQYTETDLNNGIKPQYSLYQYDTPLLSGVSYATILAFNPDGTTSQDSTYLAPNQFGQIVFPNWMAGALNGLLVVNFNDGSMATYRLSNPAASVPGAVNETSSYKLNGHYVYEVTNTCPTGYNCVAMVNANILEAYTRPTAFLTSPYAVSMTLNVGGVVQDQNGNVTIEHPLDVIVTQVNTDGSTTDLLPLVLNQTGSTVVSLPAGTFRMRFIWVNFGLPNTLYTGPQDGGGKG